MPGVTRISLASGVGAEQEKALEAFVQQVRPHDYISIQQYLPENAETDARIQRLQLALRNALRVAVTTGYGPRFLHSTGQFHKGGPATGVFLQITASETASCRSRAKKLVSPCWPKLRPWAICCRSRSTSAAFSACGSAPTSIRDLDALSPQLQRRANECHHKRFRRG